MTVAARVDVNYSHSADGAPRGVEEITDSGGQAIALKADVSREDEVLVMFDADYDFVAACHSPALGKTL